MMVGLYVSTQEENFNISDSAQSEVTEIQQNYGSIKNHKNKAYALTSETPEPFPNDYNKSVTIHW